MLRFVTALNAIASSPLAIVVLTIGCVMLILCKKWGIDTTIAGGIIGVAGNMLTTNVTKAHLPDEHLPEKNVQMQGISTNPKN